MKKTILLVEDEVLIAMSQQVDLERYGYNVLIANSGKKAIEGYTRAPEHIDLILMDIDLGSGMDGPQAAQQILDEHDVPIVFLSSHTEPEIVERTEKITSYGYIVKNSGITVLDASIKMAFKLFDERKKVEESESHFFQLFNSMREGVAVYKAVENGDDFEFVDLNDAGLLLENKSRDQIVGKRVTHLFPYLETSGLIDAFRRVHKTKSPEKCPVIKYNNEQLEQWIENFIYVLPSGLLVSIFYETTKEQLALQNLAESEEKYRNLIENMNEVVFSLDLLGQFTFVSHAAEKITGYKPGDLIGKNFVDFIHEEDLPKMTENYEKVIAGESLGGEYRIFSKDGTVLWVRSESMPIYKKGEIAGLQGILQDITDRKQQEENLILQSMVLDQIKDHVTITDLDGTITYVNQAEEHTIGRPRNEIIGKSVLLYGDDPEKGATQKEILEKTLKDGFWQGEIVNFDSSGGEHVMDCRIQVVTGEEGNPTALCGIASDVSRWKQMETKLMRERLRLSCIIEGTNVGTWEWNVQTGEMAIDERWAEMIGYTLEELEPVDSQTWKTYAHPDDVIKANTLLDKHFRGESEHYKCEMRMRHKDGHNVWILDRGKLFSWTNDGKPLLMYGTHTNITEMKRTEEELYSAYQEKNSLLHELQHRAKNSFAMINAVVNLLVERNSSPEAQKPLSDIKSRVSAISEMYDLLYESHSVSEVDLSVYLTRVVEGLSVFKTPISKDFESVVIAVKTAMLTGLIAVELVTNAVKYSNPDKNSDSSISLSLSSSGGKAILGIKDNGIGIPKDFDPIKSNTMGLQLVHTLTTQIDGKISVNTEKGTHWILEFPIKQ